MKELLGEGKEFRLRPLTFLNYIFHVRIECYFYKDSYSD